MDSPLRTAAGAGGDGVPNRMPPSYHDCTVGDSLMPASYQDCTNWVDSESLTPASYQDCTGWAGFEGGLTEAAEGSARTVKQLVLGGANAVLGV